MLLRTPNQRSGTIVFTNPLLIVNPTPTAAAHTERIWIGEEIVCARKTFTLSAIWWVKDTGTLSTLRVPFSATHGAMPRRRAEPDRRSSELGVDETGAQRLGDGVRARLRLQLGDDLRDVELRGVCRDAERAADLAVAEAVAHRREDLALARRQRLESSRQRRPRADALVAQRLGGERRRGRDEAGVRSTRGAGDRRRRRAAAQHRAAVDQPFAGALVAVAREHDRVRAVAGDRVELGVARRADVDD